MITNAPSRITRRNLLTILVTFIFLALVTYIFREELSILIYNDITRFYVFSYVAMTFLFGSFFLGVYSYLGGYIFPGDKTVKRFDDDYSVHSISPQVIQELKEDIDYLRSQISSRSVDVSHLPAEQLQSLVDALKQKFQDVLAEDIIKIIEKKYSAQILENAQAQPIRVAFSAASQRLYNEIKSLTRRNNVNLAIGVTTTAIAVVMLAYLVSDVPVKRFEDIPELLSHFIPRISIAAFIEVFSFFFLKLYKTGIQEIKYFQNELTNIDMRVVALESTFLKTPNALTDKIAPALAITDRNLASAGFSNKAGEDGQQIDAKSLIDLLDKFGKILNAGK